MAASCDVNIQQRPCERATISPKESRSLPPGRLALLGACARLRLPDHSRSVRSSISDEPCLQPRCPTKPSGTNRSRSQSGQTILFDHEKFNCSMLQALTDRINWKLDQRAACCVTLNLCTKDYALSLGTSVLLSIRLLISWTISQTYAYCNFPTSGLRQMPCQRCDRVQTITTRSFGFRPQASLN